MEDPRTCSTGRASTTTTATSTPGRGPTQHAPSPPSGSPAASPRAVPWVADHHYTLATVLTSYEQTEALFGAYRKRCEEMNYPEPGSDRFAYCALTFTGETDQKAEEGGRKLLWYLNKRRPVGFFAPPGFVPPQGLTRFFDPKGNARYNRTYEDLINQGVIIAGTPKKVIEKVKIPPRPLRRGAPADDEPRRAS